MMRRQYIDKELADTKAVLQSSEYDSSMAPWNLKKDI